MTKMSKILAIIAVLLITLSTLAAKDFAKEKIVVMACSDKAMEIAEAQAHISFGRVETKRSHEPVIDLLSQNNEKLTMTFEVKGIPAITMDATSCNYKVKMRRNTLGECWMEKIEQTKCI